MQNRAQAASYVNRKCVQAVAINRGMHVKDVLTDLANHVKDFASLSQCPLHAVDTSQTLEVQSLACTSPDANRVMQETKCRQCRRRSPSMT